MTTGRFMRPPEAERNYEVGDRVEVNCDHEKNGQRVKGWMKGTVVQVENKMIAVQFRTNIFLTDGWMVPDQILWFPFESAHVRPIQHNNRAPEVSKGDLL
ncbi:MAG: hypothetical protein WA110_07205 [Anaerolineaceae bacterium]